jgi:sigma-B regulation protein RsbQ
MNPTAFIEHKNAVTIHGTGTKPMLFLHGFGTDQTMWRYIAPAFDDSHKVVLYDHVGSGHSDLRQYDKRKYAYFEGYADDLLELCDVLDLRDIDVVAHSAGCMMAVLAARRRPDLFSHLMLLGPSPCYINHDGYVGGFSREDIDQLLAFLEINPAGWSANLAPMVMANPDRPDLAAELESFFVRNDPKILHHFASAVFLSDHRADLDGLRVPTLIMQCRDDIVAPLEVGDYMHAKLSNSVLKVLDTHGHYPQLSHPGPVTDAMRDYLSGAARAAA